MCILKTAFRTLVIGGLALGVLAGGSMLFAGPDRTAAMFHHSRDFVNSAIDAQIDDTTAMREKLRNLEREYPQRISQVSGDLAEIRDQMRQLDREHRVSARVVELTGQEVARLEGQLTDVDSELTNVTASTYTSGSSMLAVRRDTLRREAQRVHQTRVVYQQRADQAITDLGYLEKQAQRLEEALTQLENERTQFQSQLMQLERQIDAIDRNERMIEMMEKRQRTLDEVSRYDAFSMDHVTSKLSEIRSRQEAELDMLTTSQGATDWEDAARFDLDSQSTGASYELQIGADQFQLSPVTRN
jgi:chromosome segregation ATPase